MPKYSTYMLGEKLFDENADSMEQVLADMNIEERIRVSEDKATVRVLGGAVLEIERED